MKEGPRAQSLAAGLASVSIAIVLCAAVLAVGTNFEVHSAAVLATLLLLTVILELSSINQPYAGFASLSIAASLPLTVSCGPFWGVAATLGGVAVREALRGRGAEAARVESAALTFVPASTACIVFFAIGHFVDNRQLIQSDQWMAVVVATLAYWLLDARLSAACAGSLEPDERDGWLTIRRHVRPLSAALIPVAWAMMLIGGSGLSEANSLSQKLWLFLTAAIPLAALHRAVRHAAGEDTVKDLGNADAEIELLKDDLNDDLLELKNQNRALMADLHNRVDEIAILRDMGQQLGTSKNLDKTLQIVTSMIRKLIVYQSCVIYLVDSKGALVPASCASPYADVVKMSPLLQLEESMVNLAMQSKRPVLVSDLHGDGEHRIFTDEKSIICVPLIVTDGVIGVIYVGTPRPGTYNDDQVHMLETLANPAAIAIRSAQFNEILEERLDRETRLKEREQDQASQLRILYNLGSDLNRAVKLDDILDIILKKIAELVNCQSCIIFHNEEGHMVAKKVSSPYRALFTNFAVSLEEDHDEENIVAWVARNRRHVILEDAQQSRFAAIIQRERSVILVPLLAEDDVIGEIYLGSAEPGMYDDKILGLCTMVASQAALAVQKARLFDKTEALAITDGVTGLYTHRYFQERLGEEVRWAERYQRPLSLVMVDADHFKKFNDTLGHPEGDKLLKEVAALLQSYTRESDLVCRYGGDEFSLILKDTDKESALTTAERIRDAFQLRFGKLPVPVTSSIGVANFPLDARTKIELVSAADAALYRSKHSGRNCVTSAFHNEARSAAG